MVRKKLDHYEKFITRISWHGKAIHVSKCSVLFWIKARVLNSITIKYSYAVVWWNHINVCTFSDIIARLFEHGVPYLQYKTVAASLLDNVALSSSVSQVHYCIALFCYSNNTDRTCLQTMPGFELSTTVMCKNYP